MRKLVRRDEAQAAEDGFTLAEMVIAVSLLAVLVLSVSGLFESGLRALSAAKARARANEIATQGIEDLQRFSFNNLGLCSPPAGPKPAGLEENVPLSCGASPTFQDPCNAPAPAATLGTNPAAQYNCKDNNVTYTVKRYVAWVDAIKTTKRLAVFVEWTDLAGNHQVSQQSSLRAPDQAAITGLAPPSFTEAVVKSLEVVTEPGGPQIAIVKVDETGRLVSGSTITLEAKTSSLHKEALGHLETVIPPHQPNDSLDITVGNATAFPSYNGFSVTIDSEIFRVTSGAGTSSWKVLAEGSAHHAPSTNSVSFGGDQVYATLQTLAANGRPQSSTVSLGAGGSPATWAASVDGNILSGGSPFRFGLGKQYVSFGIYRAADGKSTAAFATTLLRVCPQAGCPSSEGSTEPRFTSTVATGTTTLGSSGELTGDITVTAHTKNVTSSDSVTMSFLTQAGSKTTALTLKDSPACKDSTTAKAEEECHWVGVISKTDGYRFNTGTVKVYVAAQQVDDDLTVGSIDNGETAVAVPAIELQFTAAS